jgi:chromosome condensin MukBEF MukE localization factor
MVSGPDQKTFPEAKSQLAWRTQASEQRSQGLAAFWTPSTTDKMVRFHTRGSSFRTTQDVLSRSDLLTAHLKLLRDGHLVPLLDNIVLPRQKNSSGTF